VPAGLLRGLDDLYSVHRKRLKAHVLQQPAPGRQGIRRGVGDTLVMDTTGMRLTQEEDAQGLIDQQEIFQHVPLVLAAIASLLLSRVLGARDGSLGPIMTKRGGAAGPAAAGEASPVRGGSATPSCTRKASSVRQGASPTVRRALRNTGSKT
jgi:hypothetical protein